MHKAVVALLAACGIEPRGFLALLRALVLMDLRGQHFGRATATQPHFLVSPLFWVVGQCLFISALASLLLFCRVDVFFFAFANLALSMLLIASTLLVEFHEVVLDPQDLDVIGHRPIAPRTYAAARFANLLWYVALMYLALNLFPFLLGNGLPDAGATNQAISDSPSAVLSVRTCASGRPASAGATSPLCGKYISLR